jgi:uroporphyrinogen-III decarboxylase
MPVGSYFFDTIVRQEPFDEENPKLEDNLEEFEPLADEDLAYFAGAARRAADTGLGVVANVGGTGLGDIALVPAPFLKHPKGIRDIAEWYMSTAMRRDFVHAIFSQQTEVALSNLERAAQVLGNQIDVLFVCGTDFGTQTSAFCSVQTFRDLWFPYYKRLNDWVHAHTSWRTFKHSCGSVQKFVPSFIEAGFDILNPVQCSAANMDPKELKDRYGDRLTFWGGGVDTQKTLPFGTPAEVRKEVLLRCELLGKGGGFVFTTVHNVQARTPTENLVAMIEAVHEFDGRGH